MNTSRRLTRLAATVAALALGLATASSASAAVSPTNPYQWDFHSDAPQANTYNADYSIANARTFGYTTPDGHLFLTGHTRTLGVGLDWGDGKYVTTGLRRWSFRRRSGATGPIMPSERVAMYDNFTHSYLAEGGEHFGIDLAFTSYPVYDWQINAPRNGYGSLYNTDARDYLVYNPRRFGVELMWLREVADQHHVTLAGNRSGAAVMSQQPHLGGDVSYVGSFGGGPTVYNEHLLSVKVSGWQIGLLTRGHTAQDCSTPGDVVWLRDTTLTADQLVAVFGTATPAFPVTFNACVPWTPGLTYPTGLGIAVTYYGLADQPGGPSTFSVQRKRPVTISTPGGAGASDRAR